MNLGEIWYWKLQQKLITFIFDPCYTILNAMLHDTSSLE